MRNAIIIDSKDNVVDAIESIQKGDKIVYICSGETLRFPALDDIDLCDGSEAKLLFISLFLMRYRLSPHSAAQVTHFYQASNSKIILNRQMSPDLVFYLVEVDDQYCTVYCKHYGLL